MCCLLFSIGRVDPALYAVAADTWNSKFHFQNDNNISGFGWMENYVNTLCINSWQVRMPSSLGLSINLAFQYCFSIFGTTSINIL